MIIFICKKEVNKEQEKNQAKLDETEKKLKETQNLQERLIKSNKRMSSSLVGKGNESKRKRQDISTVSKMV